MAAQQLKNCRECGRLFVDLGGGICRDCLDKQEEEMQSVASYVREHPKLSVKEICEETGVKEKVIRRMIREGWFLTKGINFEYPCEGGCGTLISDGRYCEKCNEKMAREVAAKQKALIEKAEKIKKERISGAGMHSKDMKRKT